MVRKNAGASLVDLGDGVLCVEFHSKMNVIGGDTIQMIDAGVREASRNFAALVVGNEAANFSAGANIMLVLLKRGRRTGKRSTSWSAPSSGRPWRSAIRTCRLVAAGRAGARRRLRDRAARRPGRPAAETYMGLVEVGVGLIPAGGGTKELTARAGEQTVPGGDLLPAIQRAFESIGFAKVSSSAPDAQRLGDLRASDAIGMNRDRLIDDAKALARLRAREGYQPPVGRRPSGWAATRCWRRSSWGAIARRAGRISDHDALIGRKLATIMAGGTLPHPTTVSEKHLLDLEREAFLSLVGEARTQERMQHTLKTGKPLRN